MNAFKQFGKVSRAKVARLEISAMYALSTPSCPPKARAAAIKIVQGGSGVSHLIADKLIARHKPETETKNVTAFELIDSIRKAIRVIYENAPEELRSIVAPKFRDFANELERTGDLSW